MRISDWSSDVCSSDLDRCTGRERPPAPARRGILAASGLHRHDRKAVPPAGRPGAVDGAFRRTPRQRAGRVRGDRLTEILRQGPLRGRIRGLSAAPVRPPAADQDAWPKTTTKNFKEPPPKPPPKPLP